MVKTVQGNLVAGGLRFGIVLPRFNDIFGDRLRAGAIDCLLRHGADEADITVVRVPGCFDMPTAVAALAASGRVDAVVALGVLIRGATSHYDHIAQEMTRGLAAAGREHGVPVAYGVVTAENQQQAMERCGGKAGNRGWDAALAAVEMANLSATLSGRSRRRKK